MVTVAATFGSIGYAQDLAKNQAYCRKLVDAYTLGGMDRGGSLPQGLDLSVAIDQCRSDNPEPAIRCFRCGCATPASTSRHAREIPRLRRRLLSPGFPAGRQDADRDGGPARDARSCKPTLRETALPLGFVDEKTFDRVVDPGKMVRPNVASAT